MNNSIVLTIQAILAPALGISATGLLLLGLTNRYSSMINRIRLLNEEKRKYMNMIIEKGELSYIENIRLASITKQMGDLLFRSRMARNAILSIQIAIILFVITSVTIGANIFFSNNIIETTALMLFLCGMLCVLVGVLFAAFEIYNSYKIAVLEVKAE